MIRLPSCSDVCAAVVKSKYHLQNCLEVEMAQPMEPETYEKTNVCQLLFIFWPLLLGNVLETWLWQRKPSCRTCNNINNQPSLRKCLPNLFPYKPRSGTILVFTVAHSVIHCLKHSQTLSIIKLYCLNCGVGWEVIRDFMSTTCCCHHT